MDNPLFEFISLASCIDFFLLFRYDEFHPFLFLSSRCPRAIDSLRLDSVVLFPDCSLSLEKKKGTLEKLIVGDDDDDDDVAFVGRSPFSISAKRRYSKDIFSRGMVVRSRKTDLRPIEETLKCPKCTDF